MNLHERFKTIISYLKNNNYIKNQKELGYKLGYETESGFSQVVNGKVPFPETLYSKLKTLYSFINIEWLENEKGGMILNTNVSTANNNIEESDRKYQVVENIEDIPEQFRNWVKPYYPDMRVGAGLELGNYHGPTKYFILVPFSDKVQFWSQVEGKSMLPRYNNNDLIGLTEIHYDGVFPGHIYVVALKSGSAHLKKVEFVKNKPDTLSLISLNTEFEPKEFHISKIERFFKVKMFISNDE